MALMDPYRIRRATLTPDDALVLQRNAGLVYDHTIMAYRPQRFQLPLAHSQSYDSADFFAASRPETRRSSVSSYASLGSNLSTSSTVHTTATSIGSRNSSFIIQQRSRSTAPPPPVFRKLPSEIYECILQQLKIIHLDRHLQSCSVCYLRDLYSLALTSRTWDKAVRVQLYDSIPIVGPDSASHLKKYKMKSGVRLKLLRRTLRERRLLASYVHELQVPELQLDTGYYSPETIDLVASVIMACPNFERLVGFHPTYHHTFSRLIHALSTRPKLKQHIWIIGENSQISARSRIQLPPGLMDTSQASSFILAHSAWTSLTTLFLHAHPNAVLEHDIFISVFESLPSLAHLFISSFDIDDFNDDTLLHVPHLTSLRLENLPGVTDTGLSRFASSSAALSLRSISLLSLQISSLLLIAKLFSNLTSLIRFTFAQTSCATLLPTDLIFQPLFASSTLEYLHWDISEPPNLEQDHLALSIRANGFPALRTLRAPTDPHGSLQALCKPRSQITTNSDKYKVPSPTTPTVRRKSSFYNSTPLSPTPPDPPALPTTPSKPNLHAARALAQSRLEAARNRVAFKIIVDLEGKVTDVWEFPSFMGTIGSQIEYSLKPDVPGGEEAVAGLADIGGRLEGSGSSKVVCTGLWNASHPTGKKWWWHGEKGRWKDVGAESFF